jgi:hypothetical protein
MNGFDPIATAPAIPFDASRGRLHLFGLSEGNIRHLSGMANSCICNSETLKSRGYSSAPELFDKPVAGAALRQIYEDADPKVIPKALKRGLADP